MSINFFFTFVIKIFHSLSKWISCTWKQGSMAQWLYAFKLIAILVIWSKTRCIIFSKSQDHIAIKTLLNYCWRGKLISWQWLIDMVYCVEQIFLKSFLLKMDFQYFERVMHTAHIVRGKEVASGTYYLLLYDDDAYWSNWKKLWIKY